MPEGTIPSGNREPRQIFLLRWSRQKKMEKKRKEKKYCRHSHETVRAFTIDNNNNNKKLGKINCACCSSAYVEFTWSIFMKRFVVNGPRTTSVYAAPWTHLPFTVSVSGCCVQGVSFWSVLCTCTWPVYDRVVGFGMLVAIAEAHNMPGQQVEWSSNM